jgi:hypothetical protein
VKLIIEQENAWRIYELLEELHDFLHQPENYAKAGDVERWLEKRDVYRELHDVYYHVVAKWFPVDEQTGRVRPPAGVRRRFPSDSNIET